MQELNSHQGEEYFQTPSKKVKKSLSIEIADSFAEGGCLSHKNPQNTLPSPSSTNKMTHHSLLRSPKTPHKSTTSSPRIRSEYTFCFDMDDGHAPRFETKYDDFYHETEFFDISMQKCHRKLMEDRVHSILLAYITSILGSIHH